MKNIPLYDLIDANGPASFVFKTMEEIDRYQGEIKDLPHRHNYYTIVWSTNATGSHFVDFEKYSMEPGSMFFVSPNQVHAVSTDPSPQGYVLLFTSEFLDFCNISEQLISDLHLFRPFEDNRPLSIEPDNEVFASLIAAIERWYRSDKYFKYEAIGSLLKLFFINCYDFVTNDKDESHELESGKKLLRNFKQLVEAEFRTKHKVKEYAETLCITAGYLNEVARKYLGVSAKEFIFSRILTEAKRLMMFTDKTSKEIAYELGFEDPSHFGKWFKQLAGMSFLDFKKSLKFQQ